MKCITKDGNDVLRVGDRMAEFLVRNGGYQYLPKKEWEGRPDPSDPEHDGKMKAIHVRSAKIAKEEKAQIEAALAKARKEAQAKEGEGELPKA